MTGNHKMLGESGVLADKIWDLPGLCEAELLA